jgi:hypothetical protein
MTLQYFYLEWLDFATPEWLLFAYENVDKIVVMPCRIFAPFHGRIWNRLMLSWFLFLLLQMHKNKYTLLLFCLISLSLLILKYSCRIIKAVFMMFQSKKRKLQVSSDFPENKQRKYAEPSLIKVRQSYNDSSWRFFQKWMNKFDFTTMLPQVDLSSFVIWKKLTIPKRHFEINWPLQNHLNMKISVGCALVNVHTIFFFQPVEKFDEII